MIQNWMQTWTWEFAPDNVLETVIINIGLAYVRDYLRCAWTMLDVKLMSSHRLKRVIVHCILHTEIFALWHDATKTITSHMPHMNGRGLLEFQAVDVHGHALSFGFA
jgi:hypothetical protein